MPNHGQVIQQTPEGFALMRRQFRERLQQDARFAELMTAVCGGSEGLQVFSGDSVVGISCFAGLVRAPVSTVRHYQRLGLITPYAVHGRFRFWIHNLVQLESIRQ